MKQYYPQPLNDIIINCGQTTIENVFNTVEENYPEYCIQLEEEKKRIEKYHYDNFELDFNVY